MAKPKARRASKQRFVLDTSAFTGIGDSEAAAEKHIGKMISTVSKAKDAGISCYVPPSVWAELKGMLERKGVSRKLIDRLDAWTIEKAPSRLELAVPAEFVYEYVKEVRERFNKGLREAEKAVMALHHAPESHAKIISELRDGYKKALRQGILDSVEDLDVLMLAKELGAGVIACDEGIMKWARRWGIRYEEGRVFPKLVDEHLKRG